MLKKEKNLNTNHSRGMYTSNSSTVKTSNTTASSDSVENRSKKEVIKDNVWMVEVGRARVIKLANKYKD